MGTSNLGELSSGMRQHHRVRRLNGGCADQVIGQLAQLVVQMIQRFFLHADFMDTVIQPTSGLLDAVNGLNAACEIAAALTQLRVQLRGG